MDISKLLFIILLYQHTASSRLTNMLFKNNLYNIRIDNYYDEYDYAESSGDGIGEGSGKEGAQSSGDGSDDSKTEGSGYFFITDDEDYFKEGIYKNNISVLQNPTTVNPFSESSKASESLLPTTQEYTNISNVTSDHQPVEVDLPIEGLNINTSESVPLTTQRYTNITSEFENSNTDDWIFSDDDVNLEIIKMIQVLNRSCRVFTSSNSDNFVIYC